MSVPYFSILQELQMFVMVIRPLSIDGSILYFEQVIELTQSITILIFLVEELPVNIILWTNFGVCWFNAGLA